MPDIKFSDELIEIAQEIRKKVAIVDACYLGLSDVQKNRPAEFEMELSIIEINKGEVKELEELLVNVVIDSITYSEIV